ncbi:MAG: hypothetical protein QUS13_09940 [Smithella sp.]|nr:hypothetical protein [Smithella sp.]
MKWKKQGLIYVANGAFDWAQTHAMIPTPDIIKNDVLRIYVSFCDLNGIGRIGYVDVAANEPKRILSISDNPILDIGLPGTFDENGAVACSVFTMPDQRKYLYYVGFELGTKIRYRLFTGLATSIDGGETFQRIKKTPILDRSDSELYFRCGPFVMKDNGLFKLWYVAGSSWTEIDGKMMPIYTINYLESADGINWSDEGKVCIDIKNDDEHGFGRPYVIKENGFYRMFYSIRKSHKGYRLGYAESPDGITWTRKDDEIGIDVSENSWDSEMLCYSSIVKHNSNIYMFYNGNEFGKTGFGYAVLEAW